MADITGTVITRAIFAAREALCRRPVTLDGRPATLSGAALALAVVRQPGGRAREFAWTDAAAIVAAGGAFRSAKL